MSLQIFRRRLSGLMLQFNNLNLQQSHQLRKRFNQNDLFRFITIPCPVNTVNELGAIQQLKEIRSSVGVKDSLVCVKCPLKNKCQFAMKEDKSSEFKIDQLKFYFQQLDNLSDENYQKLIDYRAGNQEQAVQNLSDQKDSNANFIYWGSGLRVIDTFEAIIRDGENNQDFIGQNEEYEKNQLKSNIEQTQPKQSQQKQKQKNVRDDIQLKAKHNNEEGVKQQISDYEQIEKQKLFKKQYIQKKSIDDSQQQDRERTQRNEQYDKDDGEYQQTPKKQWKNDQNENYSQKKQWSRDTGDDDNQVDYRKKNNYDRDDSNRKQWNKYDQNDQNRPRKQWSDDRNGDKQEYRPRKQWNNEDSYKPRNQMSRGQDDRNPEQYRARKQWNDDEGDSDFRPKKQWDRNQDQYKQKKQWDRNNKDDDIDEPQQNQYKQKKSWSRDDNMIDQQQSYKSNNPRYQIKQEQTNRNDDDSFESFEKELKQTKGDYITPEDRLMRTNDVKKEGGRKLGQRSNFKFTKTILD